MTFMNASIPITPNRVADSLINEVFLARWSPRAFDDTPITEEQLMGLLEAARWAPSGLNIQPWRFSMRCAEMPSGHPWSQACGREIKSGRPRPPRWLPSRRRPYSRHQAHRRRCSTRRTPLTPARHGRTSRCRPRCRVGMCTPWAASMPLLQPPPSTCPQTMLCTPSLPSASEAMRSNCQSRSKHGKPRHLDVRWQNPFSTAPTRPLCERRNCHVAAN
jgi:hypothetical protein